MILIIIVFLLNLIIITALGTWLQNNLFKADKNTLPFLLFNGLAVYMLLIWMVLYFYRFDWILQLLMLVWAVFYLRKYPDYLQGLIQVFNGFSKTHKVVFWLTVILVLLLTTGNSYLPDNESYYIQTIKWANEQGFARGLINIHPFLGQFSGWHILQAGFNVHNVLFALTFNDLNALFFLIFLFYWLWSYTERFQSQNYWFVLWPVVLVLLLFFIDSPSPDLPVILLSLIVFDLFIQNYNIARPQLLLQLFILALFSFLIKPTAFVNLLLAILLIIKHRRLIKGQLYLYVIFGLTGLFLWLSKNYLITGYLFYPFKFGGRWLHPAWQYPDELMQYMNQLGKRDSWAIDGQYNVIIGFWQWLQQPGWHRFSNGLFVIVLLVFPWILYFKRNKWYGLKAYLIIYFLGLFYFILLLFISPNIRFLLAFLLFFIPVIVLLCLPANFNKYLNVSGWLIFLIAGIYLIGRQNYNSINILVPKPVSKLSYRFMSRQDGNFKYYYPYEEHLFWQTGDAPLPAVYYRQLEYFKTHTGYLPQKLPDKKSAYFSKPIDTSQSY